MRLSPSSTGIIGICLADGHVVIGVVKPANGAAPGGGREPLIADDREQDAGLVQGFIDPPAKVVAEGDTVHVHEKALAAEPALEVVEDAPGHVRAVAAPVGQKDLLHGRLRMPGPRATV